MTDEQLLNLAADLARRAAHAIRGIRAAGFAVERKADRSPVTLADRTAEALIVEGLRAATPDIPVVAEEEVAAGHAVTLARRYWLVDPLDGTRDFAAGHDSFAVNVGLVEGDRAYLGAVAIPVTDEVFAGIVPTDPGKPGVAWKQDAAGRRPIRARPVPASGAVVMASRFSGEDDPRLKRFLAEYGEGGRAVATIHFLGSAVKFCRLAEGVADIYPRFGRTMEWDTAAPQAVLEAACGRIAGFDGTPLRYGKPAYENHPFLAEGVPEQAP